MESFFITLPSHFIVNNDLEVPSKISLSYSTPLYNFNNDNPNKILKEFIIIIIYVKISNEIYYEINNEIHKF